MFDSPFPGQGRSPQVMALRRNAALLKFGVQSARDCFTRERSRRAAAEAPAGFTLTNLPD
jgi:hypothetical protein